MQLILRFVIGGLLVSLFAVIGDMLKPKSFAGLFGAAPSVALASLLITIFTNGKPYADREAQAMVIGAISFIVYAAVCVRLMGGNRIHAISATTLGMTVWLGCSLAAWFVVFRWHL